MSSKECNFDGLVGPSHHYGGLAFGNIASMGHKGILSNPRAAALEGLRKMKLLHDLGIPQGVIPPQERPSIPDLKRFGFSGSDSEILEKTHQKAPLILSACCSSSSMWTANAATVTPSSDSTDGRIHVTPANLSANRHRQIEASFTAKVLSALFPDSLFFHHPPIANHYHDEGAANWMRFSKGHGSKGIEVFIHGKTNEKVQFPARQTLDAHHLIVKNHQLDPSLFVLAQQLPRAIDSGVFHNDVIAMSNENVFIVHENAYVNQKKVLKEIQDKFNFVTGNDLITLEIPASALDLDLAVKSYFFNSQLVTLPTGTMALILPEECKEMEDIQKYIEESVVDKTPISTIEYISLHQSMKNGGGPACLRLRVVLKPDEMKSIHQGVLLNDSLYLKLEKWINENYRESLSVDDLADHQFLLQCYTALDKLTQILELGSIYPFQQTTT